MGTRHMARAALFSAITCVCAMLSIPMPPVRFTLQTFSMALALLVLGGKWGSVSVWLYLALGAVGLPVFSGFRGGLGAFMDATGGFLWGFALGAWGYRLTQPWGKGLALGIFLGLSYLCGTLWYLVYAPGVGLMGAFMVCVAPYILPEIGKMLLAWHLAGKMKRIVKE